MSRLINSIIESAHSRLKVPEGPHTYYRYPARFSPNFARSVISAYSSQGDLVIDPFLGGGTTAVEARVMGRRFIGTDINPLAVFVSKVKSTPLENNSINDLIDLKDTLSSAIQNDVREKPFTLPKEIEHDPKIWRLYSCMINAIECCKLIPEKHAKDFVKCVVIKTGQWALDSRRTMPEISLFRRKLLMNYSLMLDQHREYSIKIRAIDKTWNSNKRRRSRLLHQSAARLDSLLTKRETDHPKLILTSPPYPGVHILYDKWQIGGRRETSIPYSIVGLQNNHYSSYYTIGHHRDKSLNSYFSTTLDIFKSLSQISDSGTHLVQLVSFRDVKTDLPRYLDMLETAGFKQHMGIDQEQIWRAVPNRKWYNGNQRSNDSSKELLLIHRKR